MSGRQEKYVEARARGLPREESAILAGYPAGQGAGKQVETKPTVAQELAKIRAAMAIGSGVTKEDIVQMLLDAAAISKLNMDAIGMIGAARELGRMLGFYAPEVKKTLIGLDKDMMRKAINDMTDEELLKIANARTIDGQHSRVADPTPNLQQLQDGKASEPVLPPPHGVQGMREDSLGGGQHVDSGPEGGVAEAGEAAEAGTEEDSPGEVRKEEDRA